MTIQNSSADTTANAAGIPTADAVGFAVPILEDNTDIEKAGGAASHFVQPQASPVMYLTPPTPPGARGQPAQAPPQRNEVLGCNSRVASIAVNVISIALDIASLVVGRVEGGAAYVFGFAYLVLSACGLYGAIVYKTGFVRAAVVGYWIKAVLMIIGLIAIGVMFDSDGRYESNGNIYEIAIDRTTLIAFGVILIIFYFSFAAVNAKLINDITAGIIRNPN